MAVLLVLVEAPEVPGKQNSTYLDFEFVKSNSSLLQHVQQLAWDLIPGATEIAATYIDDDGDVCTLTDRTSDDALSFATPQDSDGTKTLKITVRGVGSEHAQGEPTHKETEMPEGLSTTAVHAGYECDGCRASPIFGQRYRSLEWENFDICRECHGLPGPERFHRLGVLPGHDFEVIRCTPPTVQPVEVSDEDATNAVAETSLDESLKESTASLPQTQEPNEKSPTAQQREMVELMENSLMSVAAQQRLLELAEEGAWHKTEAEAAKQQAKENAEQNAKLIQEAQGAMKHLREAQKARTEAEEAMRDAQEGANGLLQVIAEERKTMQEALLASHDAQSALAERLQRAHEVSLQNGLEMKLTRENADRDVEAVRAELASATQKGLEMQRDIEAARDEMTCALDRATKAERIANEEALKQARLGLSAFVQSGAPLTLGIEAEEDAAALGDATSELAEVASTFKARQAFRVGRVRLAASSEEASVTAPAPACARVTVQNDGSAPWPQTTVLVNVAGPDMGLPIVALKTVEPGEVAEIEMDLEVCKKPETCAEARSIWAIMDAASGAHFGPVLVFEAVWDLA